MHQDCVLEHLLSVIPGQLATRERTVSEIVVVLFDVMLEGLAPQCTLPKLDDERVSDLGVDPN